MSQKFYKDVQIIKFCTVCGVEFRPRRFTIAASLGFCYPHRREYFRKIGIAAYKKLSAEQKKQRWMAGYGTWKLWIAKWPDRRRGQALASYHKNKKKKKNRGRKHRATKKA